MTDSLRDRLTDLIYGTVSWRDVNVPVAEEVADAVIAVVQSELESEYNRGYDEGLDWINDESRWIRSDDE